jgi:hypothetical protein
MAGRALRAQSPEPLHITAVAVAAGQTLLKALAALAAAETAVPARLLPEELIQVAAAVDLVTPQLDGLVVLA